MITKMNHYIIRDAYRYKTIYFKFNFMKNITKLTKFLIIFLLLFSGHLSAQFNLCDENGFNYTTGQPCVNTIVTSVPFLRIIPDARGGGMGDNRLTLSPDANSIFTNSSQLAFVDRRLGFSGTHTPWLRALGLKDVWLRTFAGYMGIDKLQTIGFSFRHFSLGEISFTDPYGQPLGVDRPFETDIALSYNRQLGERFAGGITLKYIYSKLANGQTIDNETIIPGRSVAGDISFTYKVPISNITEFTLGTAITNLGSKIRYTDNGIGDFIPTNLGIGGGFRFTLSDDFWIHTALDINRLLAPTPPGGNPYSQENAGGGDPSIPDYKEQSVIAAALRSFGDAPGGFNEEIRENTYSLGAEVHYKFATFRLGHFNEHKTKGNRKFFTLGAGFNYKKYMAFDISYLTTLTNQRHPLDRTVRFSLLVNFMEVK